MKLTACLLLTVVAMSTIDVGAGAIVPWTLYHQPAAYNLVQPIAVLPTNHWSTFVRSNLIGGSYSYAVQDSEAVQTISSVRRSEKYTQDIIYCHNLQIYN